MMDIRAKGLLAACSVVIAACALAPSKDDALRSRLVGKWAEARRFENAHEQQSIELSGDGRMHIEQALHDSSGTTNTVRQGTWRVDNGDFVYEIPGSCGRGARGTARECRQRIIAVTDWEWVMEEAAGIPEFRAWRYPR